MSRPTIFRRNFLLLHTGDSKTLLLPRPRTCNALTASPTVCLPFFIVSCWGNDELCHV